MNQSYATDTVYLKRQTKDRFGEVASTVLEPVSCHVKWEDKAIEDAGGRSILSVASILLPESVACEVGQTVVVDGGEYRVARRAKVTQFGIECGRRVWLSASGA